MEGWLSEFSLLWVSTLTYLRKRSRIFSICIILFRFILACQAGLLALVLLAVARDVLLQLAGIRLVLQALFLGHPLFPGLLAFFLLAELLGGLGRIYRIRFGPAGFAGGQLFEVGLLAQFLFGGGRAGDDGGVGRIAGQAGNDVMLCRNCGSSQQ